MSRMTHAPLAERKSPPKAKPRPKPQPKISAPVDAGQAEAIQREADAVADDLLNGELGIPAVGASSIKVGAADDPLEREADLAADRVMSMGTTDLRAVGQLGGLSQGSTSPAQTRPAAASLIQRACASCDAEEEIQRVPLRSPGLVRRKCSACGANKADEDLQRKARRGTAEVGLAGGQVSNTASQRVRSLPLRPLPGSVRSFMEPRFGVSFERVRISTGAAAARSAKELGARAYSIGSTIAFGAGAFDPSSAGGRRLIAHELAHTLQGQRGVQRGVIRRDPVAESLQQDTASEVWKDVLAGKFKSTDDFEQRSLRLRTLQRQALLLSFLAREALVLGAEFLGKELDGPPADILKEFKSRLIDNLTGGAGGSVARTDSRPCKAGDVEPVSEADWLADPLAFFVTTNGAEEAKRVGAKLDRSSDQATVRLFQRGLVQWGCESASPRRFPLGDTIVDGLLGPATRGAIRQFQEGHGGLSVDGVAGGRTILALGTELTGIRQFNDIDRGEVFDQEVEDALREEAARNRPGRRLEEPDMLALYLEYQELIGDPSTFGQFSVTGKFLEFDEKLRGDPYQFDGISDFRGEIDAGLLAYQDRAEPLAFASLDAIGKTMTDLLNEFSDLDRVRALAEFVRQETADTGAELARLIEEGPSGGGLAQEVAHQEQVEKVAARQDAEIRKLADREPVLAIPDFPVGVLALGRDPQLVQAVIQDFALEKMSAVTDVRHQLVTNPKRVFVWDQLRPAVGDSFGWDRNGLQARIVRDAGEAMEGDALGPLLALALVGMTLTVLSFGAASPVVSAAISVAAFAAGAVSFALDVKTFADETAVHKVGFDLDDPNFLWVVLALGGSISEFVDVARIAGGIRKLSKPLAAFTKAPDLSTSSDLARLFEAIDATTELPLSLRRSLKDQAKLKRAAQLGLINGADLVNGSEWARWLLSINKETYESLAKSGVAKALRDASPEVRKLFTKCASDCLPPWFTDLTTAQRNDVVRRMTELEKGASKKAKDAWRDMLHDVDVDDAAGIDRVVAGLERASGGGRKFWTETTMFQGNKVYRRDDLFEAGTVSSWKERGKKVSGTNVERMASGRAPVGLDGKPVNLHHLIQDPDGAIAEVSQSFHQKHFDVIHINTGSLPSGIDRPAFDKWRKAYWQARATGF